jgi:hypothetical protein
MDEEYFNGQERFYSMLRDFGFKVIQKNVKWFTDEAGNRFGKANCDLDMAVDALLQSENIDRLVLCTGDGDFTQVVRALQNKGCRVEVLAFDNVSNELKREADMFVSGYLVPNLLPIKGVAPNAIQWGALGSRVRGVCYTHAGKGYGFMRYLKHFEGDLTKVDSRQGDSPYESVFCHDSQLPPEVRYSELPSRNLIFEFDLSKSEGRDGWQAINLQLSGPRRRNAWPATSPSAPSPSQNLNNANYNNGNSNPGYTTLSVPPSAVQTPEHTILSVPPSALDSED